MTIYDEMQQIASDVLGDPTFKQGVIHYVAVVPGNGPADNPGPSVTAEYELEAVCKGVSFKYVKDGLALSTDKTVVAAVRADVTPNMNGFIKIDGVKHKIVQDISTPAAGTRVVWKWIVRKG
jgi:hypothetical protein